MFVGLPIAPINRTNFNLKLLHWPYVGVELHYFFFFNGGVVSYQRIVQDGISVIVRYNYKLQKNESIASQLPAESERCTKKVVLRTLKYRNKLLRQKYN